MSHAEPVPTGPPVDDGKQPVLVVIFILMAFLALFLYWQEGVESHSPEAQADAQSNVVATEKTVESVKAQMEADRSAEGFFRRHLWFDSEQLKADQINLQNAEYQLALAQAALCNARSQKNCPDPELSQPSVIGRVLHRFKIALLILAALFIISAFSQPEILGGLFVYVVLPLGAIALLTALLAWVFH